MTFEEFIQQGSDVLEPALTGPDDACFWLYSSGSTGKSKGTVHLQHDMVFSAETYGKAGAEDPGGRCLFLNLKGQPDH